MNIRHPVVYRRPKPAFSSSKLYPSGPDSFWHTHNAHQAAITDALTGQTGAAWYNYQWLSEGITSPPGTKYIPMVTLPSQVTPTNLAAAASEAGQDGWFIYLNEPDQSGVLVADAITAWTTLVTDSSIIRSNIRILSPACTASDGPNTTSQWFADFMAGIAASGRMPDAIGRHAYTTAAGIFNALARYREVYQGYRFWLSEFGPGAFVSDANTEALMHDVFQALVGSPTVDRIAYFDLGIFGSQPWRNMYDPDGNILPIGTYWKNLSLATL